MESLEQQYKEFKRLEERILFNNHYDSNGIKQLENYGFNISQVLELIHAHPEYRKRMTKMFPQFYPNLKRYAQQNPGPAVTIGHGQSKLVFRHNPGPVFKVYRSHAVYDRELGCSRILADKFPDQKLIPNIIWHDGWAEQEYCEPIDYIPEHLDHFILDSGPHQYGKTSEGTEVIVDFENLNVKVAGLTWSEHEKWDHYFE